MRFVPLGLVALLTACNPISGIYYDTGTPPEIDADNDGIPADVDCDDDDPATGAATTWYRDADEDGYGYSMITFDHCGLPTGYVADSSDCDDANADINPDGVEVCDGLDNDCSGESDDVDDNVWYYDGDLDNYGGDVAVVNGCDLEYEGPGQWIEVTGDCDDTDGSVNPDAEEVCNGVDDDCEGSVDEDAADASAWFADEDEDGYGNVDEYLTACSIPDGYVENWDDCNDANPVVNPGETEVCDGIDNDCDSTVDEADGNPDVLELWLDADEDGFGDAASGASTTCPAEGLVEQGGDCDDTDAAVSPDAIEICDEVDNDCDGDSDEDDAADAGTWYLDADTDGFGSADTLVQCDQPSGYVDNDEDCDDGDSAANPSATEVCNSVDDDCDGTTDVGAADASTWYPDSDGDSFGNAGGTTVTQCQQPSSYVSDSTDCDDANASANPGAAEVCDGADNDCDGSTDPDSSVDAATWYTDGDTDGYGDASSSSVSCSAPSGTVADATDCDDSDSSVFPGATEYCDEQDNDCDGDVDEDVGETFYADTDGDGYGDPAVSADACSVSSGYASNADDCDDSDAAVNPGATEVCNSVDDDCDGSTDPDDSADASTWYTDGDGDGYGDGSSSTTSCSAPSGTVSDGTDCDDANASANPGAAEVCDSIDNDCDSNVDADAVDATTWYPDSDGDAYGNASGVTVTQCQQPSSYVSDATDCDDGDSASYPGGTEVCDGADNDCDGSTDPDSSVDAATWYDDTDEDGFGDAASSSVSCSAPSGTVADATDCDDTDEYVNPSMLEVCGDTADNDCDGDTDSSPCVTEGSYEGDFTITLTETTGYSLGSDSCEGTASLSVDTTADPMISGTVECEFVGSFATYLPDTYTGTVEGDYDSDLLPSGSIDFSSFAWSFDWDDNGSTDTTLDGAFEGSDSYSILTFDYTGDFATDYTP